MLIKGSSHLTVLPPLHPRREQRTKGRESGMLVKHNQILDPTWAVLGKAAVGSSSSLVHGRLLAWGGAEGYCSFLPY